MQRSLLALMVVLTILYGCAEASKPVERVEKPTTAELTPEPPASISSLQNEAQKRLEMACKDWESKVSGPLPVFCYPAGLSPAFCHSSSTPDFCK